MEVKKEVKGSPMSSMNATVSGATKIGGLLVSVPSEVERATIGVGRMFSQLKK